MSRTLMLLTPQLKKPLLRQAAEERWFRRLLPNESCQAMQAGVKASAMQGFGEQ